MKKAFKILFKVIEYIIILLILLFAVISLTTILHPQLDGFLGYKIYTVASESMKPELLIGDVILVKHVEPQKIDVGDVIVYKGLVDQFNGKIITHKVVKKINEDGKYIFTTKGTANVLEDPDISEDQIYGVVVYKLIVPSLIKKAMSNTVGFILIIAIPMLAMMLFESKELKELLRIRKEKGDENRSDE